MTDGWLTLDRLAAMRGDGLDPAFRKMLNKRGEIDRSCGNVFHIARLRSGLRGQAGPIPAPEIEGELPQNVVRFPDRAR